MEPKTKLDVSKAEAALIRANVQAARTLDSVFGMSRLAIVDDAPAMLALLKDERVSGDVYSLPRPFSVDNITAWIEDHQRQAKAGEGLLMCVKDPDGDVGGQVISITDFQFWPQYSACEFGGVIAAHLQSKSYGTIGIRELCDWVCGELGVRLLVMTSSLTNTRSNKIFASMGFTAMGEVDSIRPDGSVRRSLYWELLRKN